jgi:hypothetical protein
LLASCTAHLRRWYTQSCWPRYSSLYVARWSSCERILDAIDDLQACLFAWLTIDICSNLIFASSSCIFLSTFFITIWSRCINSESFRGFLSPLLLYPYFVLWLPPSIVQRREYQGEEGAHFINIYWSVYRDIFSASLRNLTISPSPCKGLRICAWKEEDRPVSTPRLRLIE